MKITALQENMIKSLQDGIKFISNRPQLPVLSCFLLTAKEGIITVYATDLNMGIRVSFGGKVEIEGECVVPAKLLLEVISSLSPGNVILTLHEEKLLIKSEHSQSTVQCMSTKDFPPFPAFDGESVPLSKKGLFEAIDLASIASGIDETRPIFTSLLWKTGEHGAFACTDGYRLAFHANRFQENVEEKSLLLPSKVLSEVGKIAAKEVGEEVGMQVSEGVKQALFSFKNTQVFTRLIEGDFPNYDKILPPEFLTECTFNADEMMHAIKSALIFARESSGIIRFTIDKDGIVVSSSSSSLGTHETRVTAHIEKGDGGTIAFNGKYVLDFLLKAKDKDVWFGMTESLKPGEFRNIKSQDFRYIIMPFRVQG